MQKIVNCPKPVIAEVGGVATAAGCQLVASCDLAIASNAAQFCLRCEYWVVRNAHDCNITAIWQINMLWKCFSLVTWCRQRAAEIGLINQVVKQSDLAVTSTALALKIASKSSLVLAIGKEAFYRQKEMDLPVAYKYAAEVIVEKYDVC